MANRRMLFTISLILALPFMIGCFTLGGKNPVDSGVANTNANQALVQPVDASIQPQILAAKYAPPSLKKYTYASPAHQIFQRLRAGLVNNQHGCFKIKLESLSMEDHIFITLGDMKVKPKGERSYVVNLPTREIDLFQANSISDILSEANLDPGIYKQLSFQIKSARILINGEYFNMWIPSKWVVFNGKFEIKDGYRTDITLKFLHKALKIKVGRHNAVYLFLPLIRISSTLVKIETPPATTDGDINGTVLDCISKGPLAGVTAALEGTSFSATTDAAGKFSFVKVPQGAYSLKLTHSDHLDKTIPVQVVAGQIADVSSEMQLAVVKSSFGNTGWFSQIYPMADANGRYAEVAMETPVVIDFSSLAFTKVEVAFDSEYAQTIGLFNSYLSGARQLNVLKDLGTWWVGNTGTFGLDLGQKTSSSPSTHYVVDVTEFVRNNPNSSYFLATRNLSQANMRVLNIQMTINYR